MRCTLAYAGCMVDPGRGRYPDLKRGFGSGSKLISGLMLRHIESGHFTLLPPLRAPGAHMGSYAVTTCFALFR